MLKAILFTAILAFPTVALADGGTVRLSERQGPYQITVFTSPTPLRAGPIDISVLVQDAESGEPASDAVVIVRVASADRPQEVLTQPATTAAATNKLFRSVLCELPSVGRWLATIAITGPTGCAEARFEFKAAERLPPWLTLWPWFLWPIIAIGLFGVHQVLARRNP